ncbi:serine/threonine-protein kinase RsbW [Anaerosphaera aminiphila DSM 21120]|uniref:Serine/threonine-protein kinase RsbW n=1 Tax=Anaerosphaera aminiphila DSM 21120 TaxID=1120995 RepID=A0A1M5TJ88_9FIRM|nr:ATP-binding protein [Anaerosphaera aminiphila]SHH50842.1 serine/threonine-protein kinase RsbW [Anaerosphaera aminiphila DSM 21120]
MNVIYKFKGSVQSDLNQVKPFIENTLINLEKHICNEELMFDLKLILDELVINGVLHGNRENHRKCVFLNITVNEEAIVIRVKDEGFGIEYDFDAYDFRELKCCGRGLLLVKALTDRLELNNNEIIVVKNI